ncbi:MAG: nucleotidyltransferase family protein [Candidatus Aminicenantes bacterium]|nr:nucleotidyltransferase family protein [Candidatus Aminicenantes bacterium]
MDQRELLHHAARCFNDRRIPYFITGSVASFLYGEPRLTQDIDIVADIRERNIPGLLECFPKKEFYIDDFSIRRAIHEKSQFNIIHPSSGIKIDIIIPKGGTFDRQRFERRRAVRTPGGLIIQYSSPEDIIISKLEFYREGRSEKHLRDIAGIVKISGEELDLGYIAAVTQGKGLKEIWQDFLERILK